LGDAHHHFLIFCFDDAVGFYITVTLWGEIVVTYTLARAYVIHHQNRNDKMMMCIKQRQAAVLSLIHGDVTHLLDIYNHYRYIAEESARYIYYTRKVTSTPLEDVEQQAALELWALLCTKICGCGDARYAQINTRAGYEDNLALRPYLITSVRGRLKNYITENGLIVVRRNVFETAVIEKYGKKHIPIVESNISVSGGVEYVKPGAIPVDDVEPYQAAEINELVANLKLTFFENEILKLKVEGYTLDEIGNTLAKNKSTISRKLKQIGDKWLSANS